MTFGRGQVRAISKTYPLKQSTDFNRFVFKLVSLAPISKKTLEHIRIIKKFGQ